MISNSCVESFQVPTLYLSDYLYVICGLGFGIGLSFEILKYSASPKHRKNVYTLTNLWLILSGVIHVWIEFAFTFNRSNSLIKNALDLYGAADYRYGDYGAVMESGTAAMEAITALVDGPLCFLVAFAAVNELPWRYPLQLILCVMQIYGLVWFTLQPLFSNTGADHFSPDPFLFWGITVFMNAPWGIFPPILLFQAYTEITKAFGKLKKN